MVEVTKCPGLSLSARLKFSLVLEILGSEDNNTDFRIYFHNRSILNSQNREDLGPYYSTKQETRRVF